MLYSRMASSTQPFSFSRMALILGPVQVGESQVTKDDSLLDSEERQVQEASHVDKTSDVLGWSVDQVKTWFEQNAPFDDGRMEECLRVFQNEEVDGLSLLTLQRNHRACSKLSDFEWVLLKAARKKLLAGGDRADLPSSDMLDLNNHLDTVFWTPPTTPKKGASDLTPPCSPQSFRSGSIKNVPPMRSSASTLFPSPLKLFSFPKLTRNSETSKDEQVGL
eukprot:c19601_g1_i1 orf=45-704(-)